MNTSFTRRDILGFLEKVQAKAVKAVKDKNKELYDAAFKQELQADQEFYSLLETGQNLVGELKSLCASSITIMKGRWGRSSDNFRWNSDFKKLDDVNFLKEVYDCCRTSRLNEEKVEGDARLNEVINQYKAIEFNLKQMTSPAKMRKYLDGLGFDTSWLDQNVYVPVMVDKTKLFPCKEYGLLEDKQNG